MADIEEMKPGKIDAKSGFRVASPAEIEAAAEKFPKVKANQYRATERGYAKGVLVEEGEIVPEGTPLSDTWMEKTPSKSSAVEHAVQEAQQPLKDDPDLTTLSKPALEVLATEAGVTNAGKLSKDDLITAIKAERDNTR